MEFDDLGQMDSKFLKFTKKFYFDRCIVCFEFFTCGRNWTTKHITKPLKLEAVGWNLFPILLLIHEFELIKEYQGYCANIFISLLNRILLQLFQIRRLSLTLCLVRGCVIGHKYFLRISFFAKS